MKKQLLRFIQPNQWTCGPACAKVVLNFFGIQVTLNSLISQLRITPEKGTDHHDFIRVFRENGLHVQEFENASLEQLASVLKHDVAIVGYWIPYYKEGHYAIVKQIDSNRVYLHDTWFGPNHSYKRSYFLRNWFDEDSKRWMISVRK